MAVGKRVTITIQASQAEHTLITTNPVERAEYLMTRHEQSNGRPAELSVLTPEVLRQDSFDYQNAATLQCIQEQVGDEGRYREDQAESSLATSTPHESINVATGAKDGHSNSRYNRADLGDDGES